MIKLLLLVLVEAAVAMAVAGILLAILIPLLVRFAWIMPGDATGIVAIVSILLIAVLVVLFRPGGTLSRFGKRGD